MDQKDSQLEGSLKSLREFLMCEHGLGDKCYRTCISAVVCPHTNCAKLGIVPCMTICRCSIFERDGKKQNSSVTITLIHCSNHGELLSPAGKKAQFLLCVARRHFAAPRVNSCFTYRVNLLNKHA